MIIFIKFNILSLLLQLLLLIANNSCQKLNLDVLNNYSEFLNFGNKKLQKTFYNNPKKLENAIFKSKLDILGEIFKTNVDFLKKSKELDIVFLVDASSSVGVDNFQNELKFVKKLLSDITVDFNHSRVAIVTYSSPSNTIKNIDEISNPSKENNKCLLLNQQLLNIEYRGGETYTIGAFKLAKEIFNSSRPTAKKILFLITDGYSSGGSPVPLSLDLKTNYQVTVFTIGVRNGNYKELYEVSSSPGEFYSYLLDSYEEFESLARRALHVDLTSGDYIPLGLNQPCDKLCAEGNCCDDNALCTCGTTTGHYSCVCQPGFYGSGLRNNCLPCIPGTYSSGPNLCLPCTDVHHTTVPPAYGPDSCVCKRGFQSDGKGGCRILKCPIISPPEYGYIVKKKDCNNVLNSACGIRCEVGYTLIGNSIRICQENGNWSGLDPTCEIKTCSRLSTPKYGSVKCEHLDLGMTYDNNLENYPVDTICNFECKNGSLLIGSVQRTCLPISQWDGLRTICKRVTCNKLIQFKYGKIEPSSCLIGKQIYGQKCKIACKHGFILSGPSERICGKHGIWSGEEENICTDTNPPDLECPENITTNNMLGTNYGHVNWSEPNVTDNSGLNISIWTKPTIMKKAKYKFTIGLTAVTYFAQDAFNNLAKCKFFVEVLDKEPPVIEECIDPPPFLTTEKIAENVTWDEPNIFDNSQNVTVLKTHDFGVFQIGRTQVTYTAKDSSGNKNICKINITVEESHCSEFLPPSQNINQYDCTNITNGVRCFYTCQDGYAVPMLQIDGVETNSLERMTFVCNHNDPVWYNPEGNPSPECSFTILPEEVVKEGSILLENIGCDETLKLDEIKNDLKSSLVNDICTANNCQIILKPECQSENYEENTNIISKKSKRYIHDNSSKPIDKKQRKHNKKRKQIKFQIRGKYTNQTTFEKINLNKLNGTIQMKSEVLCSNGFVARKNRCVQCPRGTFHNITSQTCQSCDFGYYSTSPGQTVCSKCPVNYSTRKMHAKRSNECREMCSPGTHARKKKMKFVKQDRNTATERTTLKPHCKACPIGTYQPDYGKTKCIPCLKGYTTVAAYSTNQNQCILNAKETCQTNTNICNNGKCVIVNNYEVSCECTQNYTGRFCNTNITPCAINPCDNGGTCNAIQSQTFQCNCPVGWTGRYCEQEILKNDDHCLNYNCSNGGSCVKIDEQEFTCICSPGFSGETCQTRRRICDNQICENNGTCLDVNMTYKCICTKGYLGRRCNILPCDYKPCSKLYSNSLCVNLVVENATKNDYKCICIEGYTGPDCSKKIDYCSSLPCKNSAICINKDNFYECLCSKYFYGSECQYERDTKYVLHFPRYDVNDFIRLKGFAQNLTEITACLWIQTKDNFNYGTLLSYATRFSDNVFTLTDYTGLVLYVNNEYVVTNVFLNDGFWHHICASWKSQLGTYQIFVDGKLLKTGTNLGKDTKIEGNGFLVIGQEQDTMGGQFSQSESFVGNMAYINIWSQYLTENEVIADLYDCQDSIYGDLYAWPEMQENIYGNIEKLNSSFCQKCDEPKPLYNGYINIVNNSAFYSCYPGFELSHPGTFSDGRRCSKTSQWEDSYDLYCKKIFCGYPGYVENAYLIGNKFFYKDKITYKCYDGYEMEGLSTIICNENGKWYPEKPKCIGFQCVLPEITYGTISESNSQTIVEAGTEIHIECHSNAKLVGESTLMCFENGTWSNLQPCVLKQETVKKLNCPLNLIPTAPMNGYIDNDILSKVQNGSIDYVEYKCLTGYKSNGINISSCIIDGYWTELNMTCNAIRCPQPPTFNNMFLTSQIQTNHSYSIGEIMNYRCEEGYKMFGNGIIRCTMFGRWSRMQTKCNRKSCGKPQLSSMNIEIIGESYLFEDKVKIRCLNSENVVEIVCMKNGSWSDDVDC